MWALFVVVAVAGFDAERRAWAPSALVLGAVGSSGPPAAHEYLVDTPRGLLLIQTASDTPGWNQNWCPTRGSPGTTTPVSRNGAGRFPP